MPKNIMLQGAQPIGAPKDWNAERDGPCRALLVLVGEGLEPRTKSFTSAYRFTAAEQEAIADGGELFLRFPVALGQPVLQLWVQRKGIAEVVDEGLEVDAKGLPAATVERLGPSLVDLGFNAMMDELDAQAEQRSNSPEIGDPDEVGQVWMKGVFSLRAALEVALEAIGEHQALARPAAPTGGEMVLPVMTLEDVVADSRARIYNGISDAVDAIKGAARRRIPNPGFASGGFVNVGSPYVVGSQPLESPFAAARRGLHSADKPHLDDEAAMAELVDLIASGQDLTPEEARARAEQFAADIERILAEDDDQAEDDQPKGDGA